ncbi:hypothetical protein Rs2_35717 [Raphanus sativus]|nr:hypothetical protein Rs2_35717 [Raphanus sativus]
MSYWLNDGESEMVSTWAAPVEIATDKDFRIFKALHRANKYVNLFVTFRECVSGEMIFLRSERLIASQVNASVGPPDEDVVFLMQVEAIEACYKHKSQSGGMVATSKDQDKSGEPLGEGSGANTESCEQENGKACGDDMRVDNGENKGGNVGKSCGVKTASDNLPQQICVEQDTRTSCPEKMAVDRANNRDANKVASTGDMEVDT